MEKKEGQPEMNKLVWELECFIERKDYEVGMITTERTVISRSESEEVPGTVVDARYFVPDEPPEEEPEEKKKE